MTNHPPLPLQLLDGLHDPHPQPLAIFHGPRRLADYRPDGTCKDRAGQKAA